MTGFLQGLVKEILGKETEVRDTQGRRQKVHALLLIRKQSGRINVLPPIWNGRRVHTDWDSWG